MDEELEGRLELIDDRLEHYLERLEDLEQDRLEQRARVINWAMLGLFVLEVVIGIAELWFMVRHA